ncbi:MAG: SoxY-related AACIE arm protein [Caulobacterales bacterium]|nr:SoxY-related AACIE arm protein [Caulobacterales bacterium]
MTERVTPSAHPALTRRHVMAGGAGAAAAVLLAPRAEAGPEEMRAAVAELFGDRPITEGRVALDIPPIAENGYSVPLDIKVDSPMTEADHVTRIAVFSPRNPLPNMARFELGPRAGRAHVATRLRLGGSQSVLVVAEMSDGALWSGSAETVVTLAACVVL